jgi:hypothetical protein
MSQTQTSNDLVGNRELQVINGNIEDEEKKQEVVND